ncbi:MULTISPECIES: threonine/serine exporter family protein [unclassified Algibacter]|uniref:threonine/serine exporter family protein n=1 Tax=unclassified Algibacter TaxID=2615009 RepID=UPI00131BA020|nr:MULTISPECIES: threonine/serine exporter family protein [unclassified Algibacter]MCL5128253.1 threonine/serine exporter family protein [Algibacter sp. L4_22]
MIDLILHLLEVSFWSGIAAVGFGVLFNVPKNTIFTIFLLGFSSGFIKFLLLHFNFHIALVSLFAACYVGLISIPIAHKIHNPPVVFSVPGVIPMIPGYYAYETILSIMNFVFIESNSDKRLALIDSIFSNGFTMVYILIALTLGVSLPLLFLNKKTVKRIKN